MNMTAEMRKAADVLEKVARLYNLSTRPADTELSANWLRHEADVLEAPIPEEIHT